MTTRDDVIAKIGADLPSNGQGQITAAMVRDFATTLVNAIRFEDSGGVALLDFVPGSEHAAIAAGTSVYDCVPAFASAVAALPAIGGKIVFPAGKLHFSDTLNLKKFLDLEGQGAGEDGGTGTTLVFPNDRDWIVVNRWNTLGNGLDPNPGGRADGSIIRGLQLTTPTRGTVGNGIRLRARASIYECNISNAGQDAISVTADSGGDATMMGNANDWLVCRVRLVGAARHGLYVQGGDTNAGLAIAVDASGCGGCGVYDSSFLGNTHIAHQTDSNVLGPYKTDNPNGRNVFVGCYSEGGQPASSFINPTLVLGGLHGAGITGNAQVIGGGALSPFSVPTTNSGRTITNLETIANQGGASFGSAGDDAHGVQFPFWHEGSKTWQIRHAFLDARVSAAFTTALSTGLTDANGVAIPPGNIIFPGGFWVPDGTGHYKQITAAQLVKVAGL